MALKYYGPGEHPAGFMGFRVAVSFAGEYRQTYFSTRHVNEQDESNPFFRRISLQARIQEASWQADSLYYQYRRFVTSNHSSTKEGRGVGVHGITAGFFLDRRKKWEAAFSVQRANGTPARFSFRTQPFGEVWRRAVDLWADEHEILVEDRQRIKHDAPDPHQFTELRRVMNEKEGVDIPIEALHPVFKEQRDEIASARSRAKARNISIGQPAKQPVSEDIQAEVLEWFESQRRSVTS